MERTRMTNCLRIHMMNTEELARFFMNEFIDGNCDNCPAYCFCVKDDRYFNDIENLNCIEQMVKWLDSECYYYDKR